MKYIRTFDGIYVDAGTDALGLRCVRYNGKKIALSQDDDKIVKEADTIEELLDECVVIAKDKEKPFIYDLNVPVDNPEFDSEDETVYGTIWAKDGKGHPHLEPVAVLKGNKWEIIDELSR